MKLRTYLPVILPPSNVFTGVVNYYTIHQVGTYNEVKDLLAAQTGLPIGKFIF